jgi:hypothetical protein
MLSAILFLYFTQLTGFLVTSPTGQPVKTIICVTEFQGTFYFKICCQPIGKSKTEKRVLGW